MSVGIDRKTLLAYGSLGLPIAVLGYPMTLFLHPYYAGELGLGLAAISTVLLVSRLTDFVTDPLMGWISDHTRTRFGRRKPYLLIGLPVMMVGIWKLFMPEPPVGIGYMLLWNTVVYLGWTIVVLPYSAWGAELAENYMVRASITATRQVYVIIGLIGASVVIWIYQEWLGRSDSGEVLAGIACVALHCSARYNAWQGAPPADVSRNANIENPGVTFRQSGGLSVRAQLYDGSHR